MSLVFKLAIVLSMSFGFQNVWANSEAKSEHGGGEHEKPAEGEHGKPAEGEHGGGGEKKAGPAAPEWVAVEAKIAILEAKVRLKESNMMGMIEEKKHMQNGDHRLKELVLELQKENRERMKASEELEKEKTILRYRFPERAANPDRQYQKMELKSLEEMEAALGVDGRLAKSLAKAKKKYQVPDGPEKLKKESTIPKTAPKMEPLILQK